MKSKIERAADEVSDHDVDGHPDIQATLESLKKANAAHAVAVRALKDLERQVVDFRAMAHPREREIQELEQTLQQAAIGAAMGNSDAEQAWLDAEAAIEGARRYLRQHAAALPQFERWALESRPNVAALAAEVNRLEMDLAEARLQAKLEIAHDQASR